MKKALILLILSFVVMNGICQKSGKDTTVLGKVLTKIDGKTFTATSIEDNGVFIRNSNNKIVFEKQGTFPTIKFVDFEHDGSKELMIYFISNVDGIAYLIKYDNKNKKFKLVEHFSDYPDSKPIKGTKLYYSYHSSGCADMNWGSDLFYIDDFKTIRIGSISGRECNNMDEKDGIYIYKVNGKKKELLKTLPIDTIKKYQDYKWGFLSNYWTKNYKKFE